MINPYNEPTSDLGFESPLQATQGFPEGRHAAEQLESDAEMNRAIIRDNGGEI